MPLFDLSAEELLAYRITTAEPEGLDRGGHSGWTRPGRSPPR